MRAGWGIETKAHCQVYHAVVLFFGLQGESPENGSFLGFGWRLLGMLGQKSSNIGLQRLLAMRKARIWRAFLVQRRKFSETRNGWLTSEDSNSHIPDWKKPFEMSGEFPHISPEFEAGDFSLPPRPRSADRTSSLIRVSSKREYFRNQAGIFGPRGVIFGSYRHLRSLPRCPQNRT
jgi:hypothetical protein